MFFSCDCEDVSESYDLLLDIARYADTQGFSSIWTPERHFDYFGGIFPNPAITSAAIAAITHNISIRSGSFISPLHNTIRAAENWSVVDNLSKGRLGISFGSGWNVNDFIFYPERYEKRHSIMYQQINEIRKWWSGEKQKVKNSFDKELTIQVFPKPYQNNIPLWVTTSGNQHTYQSAAECGANVLTHMIGQDIETLAERIGFYKKQLLENGRNPNDHDVTLMLHTYIDENEQAVMDEAKKPFLNYLKTAVNLEQQAAKGGGTISGGLQMANEDIPEDLLDELYELTFDRYYQQASLLGTVEKCQGFCEQLAQIGVTEIACLVDFGVSFDKIKRSLNFVNSLMATMEGAAQPVA